MGTEPFEPYQPEPEYEWDYDEEPRGPQPKILWGRVVALGAVLLLAFFLGRSTAPSGVPQEDLNAVRADLADAEDTIEKLQDDLAKQPTTTLPSPTPTDDTSPTGNVDTQVYTVKSGDTLVGIAERLYGDPSFSDCIADENGMGSDSTLRTGDQLVIPPEGDCS